MVPKPSAPKPKGPEVLNPIQRFEKCHERMRRHDVPIPPHVLRAYLDEMQNAQNGRGGLHNVTITIMRDSTQVPLLATADLSTANIRFQGQDYLT